ncbi:hypothetical protein WPS_33130 [Vulcanimicrobium alpinum]|uniref:Solute-binding protein family 5 domain-containing protein n=1 Tax=Vulcanimicrobium alpinum TaxID=3016050 RepID=A0AAN2CBN7_UNVUL|nr:peptide ABC transporter substrate-binding protein [Vulcanimicrobium alpinum]BDE08037.1 hypothetical protein WPS_33130 [Vulcanimicrobium alpinum]
MNGLRACALAAASLFVAGCASSSGPSGGTTHAHWLRLATGGGDPNSLNIHQDPSLTAGIIAELSQAYLVRYDRNGNPVPELATEIPTQRNHGISADGKTIVWHLRRGVRWSDGAPFSADDVVFTVRAILNPKNNEEQGTVGWDLIAQIDEPDKNTVVFHLKRPYSDYLPLYFGTAGNEPCILPQHILGKLASFNDAPYNAAPVGIGPFRVTAWRRGDAIELEANPYYWRGKPKLERITYKLIPSQETLTAQMQTGEVDLWPETPPSYIDRLKAAPSLRVRVAPNYRTTNLDFVVTRPNVADPRVRRAIRKALDRRELVAKILHGYGFLHDGVAIPLAPPAPESVVDRYDPAGARALLDAAGWRAGANGIRAKNGVPLALDLVYPAGSAELDGQTELLRAYLKAVGIEVQSKKYAPNIFRALQQNGGILYGGKYDMASYPRTLQSVADVRGLYSCASRPPNGENASRYCSPEADALLDRIQGTYGEQERKALLARYQQRLNDDAPTIMLFAWKGGTAANVRVTGFDPPILTPFDDMMGVDAR